MRAMIRTSVLAVTVGLMIFLAFVAAKPQAKQFKRVASRGESFFVVDGSGVMHWRQYMIAEDGTTCASDVQLTDDEIAGGFTVKCNWK